MYLLRPVENIVVIGVTPHVTIHPTHPKGEEARSCNTANIFFNMATYIGNKFGKDDHDKLVSACLVMAQMSFTAIPIYLDVDDFIASNGTSSSS